MLLRKARATDVARAAALLGRWPTIPPDGRLLVLTDVAAADDAVVRGAAVIRPVDDSWIVDAAAVDDRWPPAITMLATQLCAAAAADGACRLSLAPAAAPVLAEVLLGRSTSLVGAGGWLLVDV